MYDDEQEDLDLENLDRAKEKRDKAWRMYEEWNTKVYDLEAKAAAHKAAFWQHEEREHRRAQRQ